jgi:hypothetical protein
VLRPYSPRALYHGDAASILGWHVVKLVVMNAGWLLFGIGIAMHARIFNFPQPRPRAVTHTIPPHESVA